MSDITRVRNAFYNAVSEEWSTSYQILNRISCEDICSIYTKDFKKREDLLNELASEGFIECKKQQYGVEKYRKIDKHVYCPKSG